MSASYCCVTVNQYISVTPNNKIFISNVSKGWLGPAAGAGLGWAALVQAVSG